MPSAESAVENLIARNLIARNLAGDASHRVRVAG
jgi:hypothetical protein